MLILPAWAAGAISAILVVGCLVALRRAGREAQIGGLVLVALMLIGVGVAWMFLDGAARRDLITERQAFAARVSELTSHAFLPGSPLACLNALAGDTVESSCEKTLFASPESVAAAVTFVSVELGLLAEAADLARRDAGSQAVANGLRRLVENDRFGIVAHVLATRDGCTAEQCGALGLLNDAGRVRANLAERPYDLYVLRYAGGWSTTANSPVAASAPAGTTSALPLRPPGPEVFFPSAASIPPVNIMNTEGAAPESTAATPPQAIKPVAPQRKALAPGRRPVDLNAEVARPAPPAATVQ